MGGGGGGEGKGKNVLLNFDNIFVCGVIFEFWESDI